MEEKRELPKKQLLSLQLDLSKFEQVSDEEKAQAVIMRESTTFFKDGMRKLRKNPLAMGSLVVLILIILLIVIAPKIVPYSYDQMIKRFAIDADGNHLVKGFQCHKEALEWWLE